MRETVLYLETDRLRIREFESDDAADLFEIFNDKETMCCVEAVYDRNKTETFLHSFCIDRKGAVAAVEKTSGKLIGYILFKTIEEDVYEIGWIFNKKFWRQGYAYEACSALINHAFTQLNAHKMIAEAIDQNKSVRLMKSSV